MNQPALATIASFFLTAAVVGQQASPPATTPLPPQPLARPTATSPIAPGAANTSTGGVVAVNLGTGLPVNASEWAAGASNALPGSVVGTNYLPVARMPVSTAPPPRSKITPAQLQNINQIDIALNNLELTSRDPAEQQRSIVQALQAAPISRIQAPVESIARLGNTLAAVLPGLKLTAPQRRQLAIDLNLALNSGNLSGVEAERVVSDARTVLQGSTVNNAQGVETLMSNLSLIVSDAQATLARQNSAARPSIPTQAGQSGQTQTGAGSSSSTPAPR